MNNKLDISKIKVVELEEKEGVFENERGQSFEYKNYTLHFTIGDYPLIFRAKVDKTLKEYIEEAYKQDK